MKKFLSLLLAAIMLLGCLPAMAEAGTFTANADKHMITAYKGEDENLVVPASVDGVPTPIINWQTINGAKKAVTLTLEEGITQIRSNNIASLNITQLTLPSTLEVIANNNIYQTDKLTEVTVPAAVSYVGTLTFSYCDVLTKVTFTGLCPVFGPRTFVSTAKDLVVYVPDDQLDAYKAALPEGLNIQSSGKNAVDARVRVSESDFEFDAATGTIKKYNGTASYIEIPATIGGVQVKTIGQKAFYQHPYMTVVIIPEGVETLEMYSIFAGSGLYRVELPSTLKTIGNNALWGAELDSVKLPEGLEKIGDGAFTNGMYSKVEELIIPDSVTSIGKEAFKGCTPIKIIIGANVQSLSEGAFGALNYVEEVVIRNTNGMTIDPKAFQSSKKGATITLMDGITEEVYNSYVEQLAVAYENATVNQPELAAAFPTLDAEAGAPLIGNWSAVAVTDGTDFYGMDLLGMSMNVVLNADGTGSLDMDTDSTPGGWYVENGAAIFAPILEEGGQPVLEEAIPFTMDENGRMCIDLMGLIVLLEKEGAEYAVPAIPEKPWPELDAAKAQYYVGTWDAVSYIVDGETYDAALMGPMTLILNADGTAQMIEGEEEAYELRWYAESYSAYVGPAMSALAELYFDMNGDLQMKQDNTKMIMKPHVEAKVITGADELLGDWYDDLGNKLTVTNDGNLTVTYASDGWVRELKWDMVDGAATVTEGLWVGCPIVLENGIVIISGDNAFQLFSVDGDLSAYYGDDEDDMPEAQPIGAEGEPYFGVWKADMYGMEVILTMNPDGTCAMEMMGEAEPAVWSVVDGKANVMGDELYIDGDGKLVYEGAGMVFEKAEDASSDDEMTDEELLALLGLLGQIASTEGSEATELPEEMKPYVGTWHLVYMATGGLTGDLRNMGLTGKLVLNADGTGEMSGVADDSGSWYNDEGQVRFGKADTALTLLDGGFLRYGTELAGYMVFSQNESATWVPAPVATAIPAPVPTAAPAAPVVNGDGGYVGKTFVLTSAYTVYAGQEFPVDAAAFGEYKVCFHEDGKVTFVQAGLELPGDYLSWSINADGAYVLTYAMGATVIMEYVFTPADGALSMDYYGTMMTFTPAE